MMLRRLLGNGPNAPSDPRVYYTTPSDCFTYLINQSTKKHKRQTMGIDGNLPLPPEVLAAAEPQYFLGIEGSANKVSSKSWRCESYPTPTLPPT